MLCEKMRLYLPLHSSLWGGGQESSLPMGHHGYKVHFCLGRNVFNFLISKVRVGGVFTVLTATAAG